MLHLETRLGWRQGKVCRGPWNWTTDWWTFPRKRHDAFPATPRWCQCVMAPAVPCWTSGARPARCRPLSGEHFRRVIGNCRFPGCTSSRCDAHHVEHWIDGGATSLDNLVLLCRRHHRAVHEGGFELRSRADGSTTVLRAGKSVLEAAPALPASFMRLDAISREPDDIPVWDGTPFDLVYAMDVLYGPPTPSALVMPTS